VRGSPAQHDRFRVASLRSGAVVAVDARSGRAFARHTHDEFGVGLMTAGAQRSWSGRGAVEATSGSLITVNPGEVHDGAPIGEDRSWSMLYLSPALVGAVVSDLEEGRIATRELEAPVIDDPRLRRLFGAVRRAALCPEESGAFDERLLVLFGRLCRVPAGSGGGAPRRLARVRERIDDDPAGRHGLAELAALAGASRYQTLRHFARLTGMTPHAYVMQRRLDLARRLIRSGTALADAAAEAGFADQSHLHRVFVARHGFTPGAYAAAFRTPRNNVQEDRSSSR
jgi:AraC-like DNA-binding protein/quercetin dioxygenase-like cupin family protein